MTCRLPRRRILSIVLAFMFLILTSMFTLTSVYASEWKGERVVKDGVVHVMNPAEPMEPPAIFELRELWRLESENLDGDVVFAVVEDVAEDEDGNAYIADSGLNTVHVVSPSGEYLRSIGREGEGPGEFRTVSEVFFTNDGKLNVIDTFACKILTFTIDGNPVTQWKPSLDGYSQLWIDSAVYSQQGYFAYLGGRSFSKKTISDIAHIGLFDVDGRATSASFERVTTRTRGDIYFGFDEEFTDAIRIMGSTNDGRLFISQSFTEYSIYIYKPDGSLSMIIERDYEFVERDEDSIEDQRSRWVTALRNWKNSEVRVSNYERSVYDIAEKENGHIWVGTSRGWSGTPLGVADILDVYNEDGQFIHQAVIKGMINPEDDLLLYVGNRLYVFSEDMHSMSNSASTADGIMDISTEEVVSVTCYEIIPGH